MAYYLTLANVKEAAKKAYNENRLTAQNGGMCRYKQFVNGKDCVCAIGAAIEHLDLDFDKKVSLSGTEMEINSISVTNLPKVTDIILPSDPIEAQDIDDIQLAHDNWCVNKTTCNKERFLSLIYK